VRGEMQVDNEEQPEQQSWHFNYDKICVSDSQMMPQASFECWSGVKR